MAAEPVQLRKNSPRSLGSSVLKSSTAQLRPGSPGVGVAQEDQLIKPQRPSFEDLNCSGKSI